MKRWNKIIEFDDFQCIFLHFLTIVVQHILCYMFLSTFQSESKKFSFNMNSIETADFLHIPKLINFIYF